MSKKTAYSQYHSIEIRCTPESCASCKRYQGQKVLSSEFEELIARHCTNGSCASTFKHYDDRRTKFDRRRFDFNNKNIVAYQRRLIYGRRIVDTHNQAKDKTRELSMTQLIETLSLQNKTESE